MQIPFDLVVRTSGGSVRSLVLSAGDATAARARAAQDGFQVLACAPRGKAAAGQAARSFSGFSASRHGLDVATFSHELASLLAAGLSVVEALRTLAAKETVGARRAVVLEVVKSVSEGLPLSAALELQSSRFPPLLIATVSASEQTGDLSTALLRYAEHQQSIKALRDKVVGAAIYPMLLLAVGFLVVLFLHWLVFVTGHAHKGIGHFFPWFSKARMHAVLNDIRELLKLKVGDPEQEDSFSGAIEGLGG